MKSSRKASVLTVIALLVTCAAAFAQQTQLPRAGMKGMHFGAPPSSSQPGVAAMNRSSAARQSQSPTLSLTWGIYTFPGAVGSLTAGVTKSGHILGAYGPNIDAGSNSNYGFLLKSGKFATISYPGAAWTQPNGINDAGVIVGGYGASLTDEHGFRLAGTTYTPIDYPGATATFPFGINKSGSIVGEWIDAGGSLHGFLLSKNAYTSIDAPGAIYTFAEGINNGGEICGWYLDGSFTFHGFLLQGGTFTTFDYPGDSNNYVADINDNGVIAGGYGDPVVVNGVTYYWPHSYVYQNGTFTTFDAPFGPPAATQIWHLNNYGVITGNYIDNSGTSYGFEVTVGQ
jgi:hypothetical protein